MSKTDDDAVTLRAMLDQFDACPLECDGMTRVLAYRLSLAGEHRHAYVGQAFFGALAVAPHFWIVCRGLTVDYRLRMWTNARAPHGVFDASAVRGLVYEGERVEMPMNDFLFHLLSGMDAGQFRTGGSDGGTQ